MTLFTISDYPNVVQKLDADLMREQIEQFCQEIGEIHLKQLQLEDQQKRQELNAQEERERFKKIENLKHEEKEIIRNAGLAQFVGEQVTKQIQEQQNSHNQQQSSLQVSTNLLDLVRQKKQGQQPPPLMPLESSAIIAKGGQKQGGGPPPLASLLSKNPELGQPPNINTLKVPTSNPNTQQKAPQKQAASNKAALLDEIRNQNLQLRHVETNQKSALRSQKGEQPKEFSKQEEVSITAQLAAEVNRRRKELKKNYLDETEEESPWEDSDEYDF